MDGGYKKLLIVINTVKYFYGQGSNLYFIQFEKNYCI